MNDYTDPHTFDAGQSAMGEAEDTAEIIFVEEGDEIFDVSEWLEPDGWDPDSELGDL